MAYARLFLVVLVVNSIVLWFGGDFNVYLGHGDGVVFKAFASPRVRLTGSVVGGLESATVSVITFWLLELFYGPGHSQPGAAEACKDERSEDPLTHLGPGDQ